MVKLISIQIFCGPLKMNSNYSEHVVVEEQEVGPKLKIKKKVVSGRRRQMLNSAMEK